MPELEVRSAELNADGLMNDALIVNREFVFRFAKHAHAVSALASEAKILQLLDGQMGLLIPTLHHAGKDVLVHHYIEGEALTRAAFTRASEIARNRMAKQIGQFLAELSQVSIANDVPESLAPMTRHAWQEIRLEVREEVYPMLLPHQIEWADHLFDQALSDDTFFDYAPAIIHGDLAPYHILYREGKEGIRGIIDFGVAGRGDPAIDLAMLLQFYGEIIVDLILQDYPQGRRHLKRARFHAQAIELEWALNGIKTGQRLWFMAHLGGAREIRA